MGITLPWRSDLNGLEQCRTLVRHECFLTHSVHGQSKSARLHQLHPTPPAQVPFWTTRNDEVKDGSVVGSEQLPQKVSASESQRAPQLLYLPFRRWWFKLCLGYVGSHAEHCVGLIRTRVRYSSKPSVMSGKLSHKSILLLLS